VSGEWCAKLQRLGLDQLRPLGLGFQLVITGLRFRNATEGAVYSVWILTPGAWLLSATARQTLQGLGAPQLLSLGRRYDPRQRALDRGIDDDLRIVERLFFERVIFDRVILDRQDSGGLKRRLSRILNPEPRTLNPEP
jgi:hypothetical protein